MTRVLLTGAGGFVGHHTLEHILVKTDWDIVCTDSFRHRGKTDRIREVLDRDASWKSRVTVLSHDLTVPFSSQFITSAGDIDVIISMASESHVDRSISEPASFIRNNVDLVLNLLDLAVKIKPKLFLQVSTDEVYGPAYEGYEHKEWDTVIPSNPYSASKAAQEAIAISYWRTYGVPLIISNTMNIIGERQDPEKFMPMTLKRVVDGVPMIIHASPQGKPGSRFYLHARNQADALLFMSQKVLSGELSSHLYGRRYETLTYTRTSNAPLRFHVVGEREVDNLEMAQLIAQAAGMELKYELVDFHSSRPGHDLRYALDGSKIAALGWTPPVSLESSIKKTVEWTLEHDYWLAD